jgi:ABC-2 type transport system permease protein
MTARDDSLPGGSRPGASRRQRLAASLRRIRALLRKELTQIWRDPRTKRLVLAAPIVQLLLFGYAVTTDVHDVTTIVVDHDRSQASRSLQEVLQAGGYFRIVERTEDSRALARALDRGSATIGLDIPRGFQADLAAGRGARVQVLVDGTNSNTGTVAQGYIARIVQQYGLDYARAQGAALAPAVDLRTRAWYNPGLLSRVYNVPAVVGALITLMCLLLTSLAVVRERELGTLEQLMVSPLTATELILGKTVPVILIGYIDLTLVTAMALLWFGVPFQGSVLLLFGAAFVYILSALGLGLFISTISKTQQEAFMGMFLVMMPIIILSGFMYPVHSMPLFFQRLTLLNPLRHFLEVVRAIFLKGAGVAELWPQLLAITAAAVVLLSLSIWRFRNSIR